MKDPDYAERVHKQGQDNYAACLKYCQFSVTFRRQTGWWERKWREGEKERGIEKPKGLLYAVIDFIAYFLSFMPKVVFLCNVWVHTIEESYVKYVML